MILCVPLFTGNVFQRGRLTPKQKQLDDLSVATFRKREKLKDDINKIFVNKFEKRPIEIFPDVLIGGSKKCGTIVRVFYLNFDTLTARNRVLHGHFMNLKL